jgi:Tfp pilus assembly protein PilN
MLHLGLAIGVDRVVAVEVRHGPTGLRPRRVHRYDLTAGPAGGAWPELRDALERLEAAIGGRAVASVALLGDLARTKVVSLPPVPRHEQRQLIARNASRYFLDLPQRVVADVAPLERARRGAPARVMAACAEAAVVDAVIGALADAKLAWTSLTTASPAVLAGALALVPVLRRTSSVLAIHSRGWCEGIAVQRGRPSAVIAWSPAEPEAIADLAAGLADAAFGGVGSTHRHPVVLVSDAGREEALAAWQASGTLGPLAPRVLAALEPAALAAFGATLTCFRTPQLLPEVMRPVTRRHELRRALVLAGAAALVVLLAGAAHLWGLNRELAAVRAARAAEAANVREALALQRDLNALQERLVAIGVAENSGRPWTAVLASLARSLPDSAYLVSFSADSGALRLDGVASGAASVAQALQRSSVLRDVTLVTAFRQGGTDDNERFALTMNVSADGAPPERDGKEAP